MSLINTTLSRYQILEAEASRIETFFILFFLTSYFIAWRREGANPLHLED